MALAPRGLKARFLPWATAAVTLGALLPLADITLTDIGTKVGGVTPEQIALVIMQSVTSDIIAATANALGGIGKTGGASAAETVKKAGDAIKGLFRGDKK